MGRIVGIDYGLKRSGIAATDILQIAVHPQKTVKTSDLKNYILEYLSREEVDKVVIGKPMNIEGNASVLWSKILEFKNDILLKYPDLLFDFQDESYSSRDAMDVMLASGMKKSKRRKKENLDLISAVIILQRYLRHI